MEVDRWVQFSCHFEHAGGSEPRTPDFLAHLYASLFAFERLARERAFVRDEIIGKGRVLYER